ncbi:hypothetical protein SAMN05444410_11379 [Hydrobacter penzbergensis]|jgi:hypothetical protein|uniref:Uncharacterized protein n=1 Tax=Hydrobacter penzbergensis TaxID=1235997 RepID=A0A8X8LFB0_9BACT|nr:hypothetical protein [Hydrobacter penzbergensis]MBN8718944.1 hypothetical protein [Sediminibacterium magnilacihabitans]PQV61309.1 hypothetical protein CLV53_103161 [Sediminibacterium magnilacihabitans]SDX32907.1 hypothetical protein SAMN05444410_11379 [Hydrobacter penzbergensis]
MTDQDIKRLIDMFKKKLSEKRTKEQAFASLVSAGILTKKGNYTKPYRNIGRFMRKGVTK